MSWLGAVVGGAIGVFLGAGPLGAVIGGVIGHLATGSGEDKAKRASRRDELQAAFITALFSCNFDRLCKFHKTYYTNEKFVL